MLKKAALVVVLFLAVYGATIVWWRLWMYDGVFGPIPILHWIIPSDGESSYTLTESEMFLHVGVVCSILVLGFRKWQSGKRIQ